MRNPYADFLDVLERPSRYIGGEFFSVRKDFDKIFGKAVFCFPDTYEIGMAYLGLKILYEEINRFDDLLLERCFAPWPDLEKEIVTRNLDLVSLETYHALRDFDVVGFTLQYEMSYTNILTMLNLGRIPIFQKDRDDDVSIVIAGGPCATHPEPLAPFFDLFVIGDGEEISSKLLRFIATERKKKTKRECILKELSSWEGIYVPSLYQVKEGYFKTIDVKIKRHMLPSLTDYPFPTKSPIPHLSAVFDRSSVEISRGCTEGCRFCQAGMIYRPLRERAPEKVTKYVLEGVDNSGIDEAGLTCLSTTDYSKITPLVLNLLEELNKKNVVLGLSSLRATGLHQSILDKLSEIKNTGLTFAPEAGSDRLRKVINKNITEEAFLDAMKNVFSRGWEKVKLYFMIGLPTENDDDIKEIATLGQKVKQVAKKFGVKNPTVTISASSFVPKPHTPFQWEKMISISEIEEKQELLFQATKDAKLSFRKHVSKISLLESVIARGDRDVAQLIYSAWRKGARFDSWPSHFSFDNWKDFDFSKYLNEIKLDEKLPWDHIDVGVTKTFLLNERKKAYNAEETYPCLKLQKCHSCGVKCDLSLYKKEKEREYIPPKNLNKNVLSKRKKRGQFIGFAYRISFSKLGPISFISNLDLQKIMAQIFRRANIEVLYSEGFNIRPLISFGVALPLGINSLEEYLDVRVQSQFLNFDDIKKNLQSVAERGIIFNTIEEITVKTPSIQSSLSKVKYFIPIVDEIKNFVLPDKIFINSYSKKDDTYQEKDVRPYIDSFSIGIFKSEHIELIKEVEDISSFKGIFLECRYINGSTLRPIEMLKIISMLGFKGLRPIKISSELL